MAPNVDSSETKVGQNQGEETENTRFKRTWDCVIFALDFEEILTPNELDGTNQRKDSGFKSPSLIALECVYEFSLQRVITHPQSPTSVVAVSKSHDGTTNESTILELIQFGILGINEFKYLHNLITKGITPYGNASCKREAGFVEIIQYAAQLFENKAGWINSRRLIILTDQIVTKCTEDSTKQAILDGVNDLITKNIRTEVFIICETEEKLSGEGFLSSICENYNKDVFDVTKIDIRGHVHSKRYSSHTLLGKLMTRIYPRKIYATLPIHLGNGMVMGVNCFCVYKRSSLPRSSLVYNGVEDGVYVTNSKSIATIEGYGQRFNEKDVEKAIKFAGKYFHVNQDSMRAIYDFGEPLIRILGFASMENCGGEGGPTFMTRMTGVSWYLQASEQVYNGSKAMYKALYDKLYKDKKFGLTWCVFHRDSTPIYAIVHANVLPFNNKPSEQHEISKGLWLSQISFSDARRQLPHPLPRVNCGNGKLVECTKEIIRVLMLPGARYDPLRYPNPSLKWMYKVLQSLGCGENLPVVREDRTHPRYQQMEKRAGDLMQNWNRLVERASRISTGDGVWKGLTGKRPLSQEEEILRNSMKKPGNISIHDYFKRANQVHPKEEPVPSDGEISMICQSDEIYKLTVNQLRAWLTSKRVNNKGKKAELIDRVREIMSLGKVKS